VVGKYTSRLKTLQSISDNLNNLFTRQIIVHHTKSYELMHETILDNLFNIKLCLQAYDRHKYILNKLSLVGLQGLSLKTPKFSLYFSGSCIPTNESLFILLALPTLTVQVYPVRLHDTTSRILFLFWRMHSTSKCV
jgi:hypothetical protein